MPDTLSEARVRLQAKREVLARAPREPEKRRGPVMALVGLKSFFPSAFAMEVQLMAVCPPCVYASGVRLTGSLSSLWRLGGGTRA